MAEVEPLRPARSGLPSLLRRAAFYAVFGGSGVMLDFLTYSGLLLLSVNYQIANLAGYLCGTVLSFVLNRSFNYKVTDRPMTRFAAFLLVACFGLSLSAGLLFVMVGQFDISPLLAKAITLIVVAGVQFGLNTAFTFRRMDRS